MKSIIKNRKILIFFIVLVFIAGIYSYVMLPKQESPDISVPAAIVTCVYPGASQEDVEQLVTSKIDDEIKSLEGYDYVSSFAMNSYSLSIFELEYGGDIDKSWDDLRTKMDELQEELPSECLPIETKTDLMETAGMVITLSGENYSYEALSRYGEAFIDRLSSIDGVRRFEMDGKIDKELIVELDIDKVNRLSLSFGEILKTLQGQNIEIPSGLIEEGDTLVPLNIGGSYESIEDIENLIIGISPDNHSALRLKDVGKVYYDDSDAGIRFKNNGQNAIILTGYFKDDQNVLLIGDDVRSMMDAFKTELPSDIDFHEVIFQPNDVSKSIDNFMVSLIQGIILVILVVFVGMGFRNAIIVSLAIPLAIVMTFLTMPFMDVRIHNISIVGLIVALGMLVDNAIVVSDSIQYKLDSGLDRLDACVDGAKEVLMPVFSSTLTTVATLLPLLLLSSSTGDYIRALPLVVIIALIASFIVAVIVTPTFAYIFFKPSKNGVKPQTETIGYKILDYVMDHRLRSLIACMLAIVIFGLAVTQLEVIFFPKADKDIMYIDVEADKTIDRDYTESVSDQVEAILGEEEGVLNYSTAIGGGFPKFFSSMMVYSEQVQNAQILIQVDLSKTPYAKNEGYAQYLQGRMDGVVVGGKATIKELENASPVAAPITIRLTGDSTDEVKEKADILEKMLMDITGTTNVRTDYTEKRLEYTIDLDTSELSYMGLTKYDVLNEVSIALRGRQASTYRADGNEYDIILKGDKDNITAIENLQVKSSITGNKYLLKDFGSLELSKQQPIINKYDGNYSITVMSDVLVGYSSDTILEIFMVGFNEVDFGDVNYRFNGVAEEIQKDFGSAGVSAIVAVFAIYSILLLQFRSYSQPFIILFTVPLSSVGALFGLFIMDQPISFTGLIGIISLIGIVVNNAIVLLDYINLKKAEGMTTIEACKTASVIRFRPIILSTVTTISGLMPLLLGTSELFKPMAVSLVFGLLISTMLTLVFIPLIYSLFIRDKVDVPEDDDLVEVSA